MDAATDPQLHRHILEPEQVGLRRAEPNGCGWARRRSGSGWRFTNASGKSLSDAQKRRCLDLAIPPAWQAVWISPSPRTHIQAYGEDAAGRRQYIYHDEWRAACEAAKFEDLPRFAEALPRFRAKVSRVLKTSDDDGAVALATLARLIDVSGIRIGNPRSARTVRTYGAATLKRRHLRLEDNQAVLKFKGKGGVEHERQIDDPILLEALQHLAGLPGPDLFAGPSIKVTGADLNDFIADCMRLPFTAKDFRTWGGSVAAAGYLRREKEPTIKGCASAAADYLGNTPAIAQSSYIHPQIIRAAKSGEMRTSPAGPARLRADERCCFALITGAA